MVHRAAIGRASGRDVSMRLLLCAAHRAAIGRASGRDVSMRLLLCAAHRAAIGRASGRDVSMRRLLCAAHLSPLFNENHHHHCDSVYANHIFCITLPPTLASANCLCNFTEDISLERGLVFCLYHCTLLANYLSCQGIRGKNGQIILVMQHLGCTQAYFISV